MFSSDGDKKKKKKTFVYISFIILASYYIHKVKRNEKWQILNN